MSNVYQLTISASCAGQFIQTIEHYTLSEAGSLTPFVWADDLMTDWLAHDEADWLAALGQDYVMSSLRCKRVTGGGGPTAINLTVAGDAGSSGANTGDTSVSGVIEFPVLLNGKNVTGKIFVPLFDGTYDQNKLAPAALTLLNTVAGNFKQLRTMSGAAGTRVGCVYSRRTGSSAVATISRISAKLGTQRRRLLPI